MLKTTPLAFENLSWNSHNKTCTQHYLKPKLFAHLQNQALPCNPVIKINCSSKPISFIHLHSQPWYLASPVKTPIKQNLQQHKTQDSIGIGPLNWPCYWHLNLAYPNSSSTKPCHLHHFLSYTHSIGTHPWHLASPVQTEEPNLIHPPKTHLTCIPIFLSSHYTSCSRKWNLTWPSLFCQQMQQTWHDCLANLHNQTTHNRLDSSTFGFGHSCKKTSSIPTPFTYSLFSNLTWHWKSCQASIKKDTLAFWKRGYWDQKGKTPAVNIWVYLSKTPWHKNNTAEKELGAEDYILVFQIFCQESIQVITLFCITIALPQPPSTWPTMFFHLIPYLAIEPFLKTLQYPTA